MKDLIKKILKEENDFDWVKNTNPLSKSEIANKLNNLEHTALVNTETSLVKVIYSLALEESELDKMVDSLDSYISRVYDNGEQEGMRLGHQEGYHEGHYDGERDSRYDIEDELEEARNDGYDEGYEDGKIDMSGELEDEIEKQKSIIYNRGFEDGRAYEAELDTEDYERRESDFNPYDYDGDYEN